MDSCNNNGKSQGKLFRNMLKKSQTDGREERRLGGKRSEGWVE